MKILRFLVLAAIFATALTPLVIVTPLVFPFITGKAFWFRVCLDLALLGYICLAYDDPRLRIRWTSISVTLSAVLAVMLIADSAADNPWKAFLSTWERMDGWLALLHFAIFVAVAGCMLDTERLRRAYLWALLTVSAAVAGVGFWQLSLFIDHGYAWAQIGATFGNAVYLGQYAALTICVAGFLWQGATLVGRAGLAAAALLNLAMVYVSQGRAASLALLAAGAVAVFSLSGRRAKIIASGLLCAAALILIALPHAFSTGRNHWVIDVIDLSDPRLTIWQTALDAARERPFLGWGQDNIREALHNMIYADRAHNLELDWLLAGGVFGLWAWGWFLWALRTEALMAFVRGERAAVMAFLACYLVDLQFFFDTAGSYLLLGAMAAVISSRYRAWCMVPVRARPAPRLSAAQIEPT